MANVMAAGKGTGKNSTRKVLADKTNATPVAGLVPVKSGKKASAASKKGESTPCGKMRPLEQAETPVMRGEDLLRSLVHSNLAMIQTPSNGVSSQSPQADTPQFRVSTVSAHVGIQEAEAAAELSTASEQVSTSGHGSRISLWRARVSRDVCMNELGPCMCSAFVGGDLLVPRTLVFTGGGVVSRPRSSTLLPKMELPPCQRGCHQPG